MEKILNRTIKISKRFIFTPTKFVKTMSEPYKIKTIKKIGMLSLAERKSLIEAN